MSRKIILVESCKECPFSFKGPDLKRVCKNLSRAKKRFVFIPDDVYYSRSVWGQCPLGNAEGFV